MEREEARKLAQELVSRMTLDEKASQLKYDAPAIPRLGIPAYNWWNEALHGVARAGTATVFPQAIGLAAAFDEDLQEQIADVISTEARAKYNMQSAHGDRDIYKGLTMWSPNINIFRDPRWGRGHETYGEDPYLTARLGVRFINGLQGKGKYLKVAACAKHFAVHSGPEALRHEFDAKANPKDMQETYLSAFKEAVCDAGVESVMGAYNRVNGEPACGSRFLLKETLREKWGFAGHVVSDCWAIRDFHTRHMVTATAPESAALALNNGCDLNCGNTYLHVLEALQEGLVTEETITEACERLFTTRYLLGLFSDDCEYDNIDYTENDTDEHDALAELAAEKTMVLLKNDGILPLNADEIRTVAVIGPNADSIPALEGNYNGTSSRYITFLEGIRGWCSAHGIRTLYSTGSHLFKDRSSGLSQPEDRIAEAVACAEKADAVIVCVGLDATLEGEEGDTGNEYFSGDKNDLNLPKSQITLLNAIEKTGKKFVTVLSVGSSLNVPQGNAQLLTWYPGQAGGKALARILFGEISPSGRLPVTFYHDVDDVPAFENYDMKGRTYRYLEKEPLYPFGYGLSYTRFSLKAEAKDRNTLIAEVTNEGTKDSDTVVQVYVKARSEFAPLHPRLCGFKRVSVKAGETVQTEIKLDKYTWSVINGQGERVSCEEGELYAGFCQPDEQSEKLSGTKTILVKI